MSATDQTTDNPKKRGLGTRVLLGTGRLIATLVVVAGAAFAVQFGAAELSKRAEAVPAPDPAPVIPVSYIPLTEDPGYAVTRTFIGQVEARKSVDISFELGGRLDRILVDEGETVTAGQLLATQDTVLLEAERDRLLASRNAIEAQLRFANQTLDRNSTLTQRGFTSQARLDEASARKDELTSRVAEIVAGLRDVEIRIDKASVYAPFNGRVTVRLVDGGETMGAGQRVLGLVETSAPQARIGVPVDLNLAMLSDANLQIGDMTIPARLVSLRPDVDPVTRTRTALFEFDGDADTAFGRTARLHVAENIETPGTWVPTTALKEGVRGQWTLLVADADGIVRNATVEILHADSGQVFVRGAFPDGTVLIDKGPQRVTVGQRVSLIDAG